MSEYNVSETGRVSPKLEDHSLSAVRDCLFKIFIAFSSIRNLRRVIPW
jgi:hypothetical protein